MESTREPHKTYEGSSGSPDCRPSPRGGHVLPLATSQPTVWLLLHSPALWRVHALSAVIRESFLCVVKERQVKRFAL